jgi:DNA repair protein RadC
MAIPFKKAANKKHGYILNRPASPEDIINMAMRLLSKRFKRGIAIKSPTMMQDFLKLHLSLLDHECFFVVFLDNRHRILAFEKMFRGTIDGASVYPREVVKAALTHGAAAVIFAHNHPSGVSEPSEADRHITKRLADALGLVEIRTLDHFIVAGTDVVSFAERGWV